jgi:hypothetical protein
VAIGGHAGEADAHLCLVLDVDGVGALSGEEDRGEEERDERAGARPLPR